MRPSFIKPQLREDLSAQQTIRIKGAFQAHLMVEIGFVEHFGHQVALLNTNTMLTGQHPANLNVEAQNVRPEILCFFQPPGIFASYRISGCRLPSPAWNTLATRSPY